MRRVRLSHVLLLLVVALVLTGVGRVAYIFICGGPSLSIKGNSQSKDFETLFLGEYCDSLSRVRVLDMTEGVVVWEAVADSNFAFCRFTLSRGENPALIPGISKVMIPVNKHTFTLLGGRRYEVTVWGREARGGCGASSQRVEF